MRSPPPPDPRPAAPRARLLALLAVHDRRPKTVECLARLEAERLAVEAEVEVGAVLVDDGSTDGTAEAVRRRFPWVRVVPGSGQLYWNGGMRRAFEVARPDDPDFYLWLNDDTYLRPGALRALLATEEAMRRAEGRPGLVVGSTVDPGTGRHSYGGWRRGRFLNPLRLALVPPGDAPLGCDTVHGNCVLVPREVVRAIGILDDVFVHSMGDLDYGFRAGRAGCGVWIAPGFLAECEANSGQGLFSEAALTPAQRWRRLVGPKGLPPRAWLTFTSRHAGPLWLLNFLWPYLTTWWRAPRRAPRRGRAG